MFKAPLAPTVALAALAILWPATPASAQTSTTGADVVVHAAKPLAREAARKQISAVARDAKDQLARFNAPVCPRALGLSPAMAAQVEAAYRTTAAGVGARVEKPPCDPNILIIVTDQPAKIFDSLRPQGQPDDSFRRAGRDLKAAAPAIAWSHAVVENEDGQGASDHTMIQGLNGVMFDIGPSVQVKTASIIGTSTQMAVTQAFVIIDPKAALGKTPVQLADYAAMRTLAETQLPKSGQTGLDTILTLFEPATDPTVGPPSGLSTFDRQYLSALYSIKPTQTLTAQEGDILRHMTTEANGAAPAKGN